MPLVNMQDMLRHARANRYAVGAYDVVDCNFIAAVIGGAERAQAPVIISFAESHFAHYDFPVLFAAAEVAAKRASVPVALGLNYDTGLESAAAATRYDANGVMSDEQFCALVARGEAKINYYMALSDLAAAAATSALEPMDAPYTAGMDAVRLALASEVVRTCGIFGAAGRAEAALSACQPRREAEQLS